METEAIAVDLRARAQALMDMAQDMLRQAEAMTDAAPGGLAMLGKDREILLLAKAALDNRKLRGTYFRTDLFGEPGWHILLDLFIQQKIGDKLSVTGACIGSGAPTTTALRYLNLLIEDGLVQRDGDPSDGRRSWLTLTPQAIEAMTEYLEAGNSPGRSGKESGGQLYRELT